MGCEQIIARENAGYQWVDVHTEEDLTLAELERLLEPLGISQVIKKERQYFLLNISSSQNMNVCKKMVQLAISDEALRSEVDKADVVSAKSIVDEVVCRALKL